MNTKTQMIALADKVRDLLNQKKGILTLTFVDKNQPEVTVRLKRMNSELTEETFYCTLYTFTSDIEDVTQYDMKLIKDIK